METISHLLTAFNIFPALSDILPAIFQPLIHGFQNLFASVFGSMKHIVVSYPGLISGSIFISMVYLLMSVFSRLRLRRVRA